MIHQDILNSVVIVFFKVLITGPAKVVLFGVIVDFKGGITLEIFVSVYCFNLPQIVAFMRTHCHAF